MSKRLLNLGCGTRFHPDWENLDFFSHAPGVRAHDLRTGIPYPNQTFDVVYHSHLLEHFSKEEASVFLRECHRVLKPGGIVRVAVPDLEAIARLYIEALEKASKGVFGWDENYRWMVMEMFDQFVREDPRGALVEYLKRDPLPNLDFVVQRWGPFVIPLIESIRKDDAERKELRQPPKLAWDYMLRNPLTILRNKILRLLLSQRDREALRVGQFRRAGHIHMWMYDSYSLGKLLEETGFRSPQLLDAAESRIRGWAEFQLDNEPDGRPYKADSIYMEAMRP